MKSLILLFSILLLAGCTENARARKFGGAATYRVEAHQKVVNVTWKEADLWILTRPAKDGEVPETLKFQEKSSLGILEGTIILQEQ
jgi:hypothetical protein